MVRTTRAVTRLSGSAGDNVIAERATAMVNVRIAVGSSVEEAARDIRRAVDDPAVAVRVVYGSEPAPVSRSDGPAWQLLSDAITDVFPTAIVTPVRDAPGQRQPALRRDQRRRLPVPARSTSGPRSARRCTRSTRASASRPTCAGSRSTGGCCRCSEPTAAIGGSANPGEIGRNGRVRTSDVSEVARLQRPMSSSHGICGDDDSWGSTRGCRSLMGRGSVVRSAPWCARRSSSR